MPDWGRCSRGCLLWQVLEGLPDWDSAVAHVRVPTLLLAALDDETKPFAATRELLDEVSPPV